MRAYTDCDEDTQYFFDGKSSSGSRFALYKVDGKLRLYYKGTVKNTNLSFSSNEWHTISISVHRSSNSTVTVRLDDQEYSFSSSLTSTLNSFSLMIGRKYDGETSINHLGESKQYYPLYGQIEMLSIANEFCDADTINRLFSELKCVSRVHEYDDFGMLKKTELHQAGESIMYNGYMYDYKDTTHVSPRVLMERIGLKTDFTNDRYYESDALGKITLVGDSFFGTHSYSYDYRGYLVSSDETNYEYDNNGNVTKIDDKVLTYDTTIKDKLISYDGNAITYATDNPFNPATYKDCAYSFEGRRLIKFAKADVSYNYTYDDKGLRIQKTDSNGNTTSYKYDGNKLITEIGPRNRLDFLYDENGDLYGFIVNSRIKYYYIRDCLKNILGIVDINGKIVVKYNYDAYGKCTVTSLSSIDNYAVFNPFRFKGYYYDSESEMYYCQSRYYVPEWGRWLNADNPAFLDFESLNGMNLYACCNGFSFNSCNNVSKRGYLITGDLLDMAYMDSSGNVTNKPSKNPLGFSIGLMTPEQYEQPSWMSISVIYAKGSLGWGYTINDGYSIASFNAGIIDATFHTPKWFPSLSSDDLANPNVYLGFGTLNLNASIGVGVSGTIEILSGTIGIRFGDAITIGVKGYVGIGVAADFINGIKVGKGWGLGYEISLNIDWYKLFH